MDGWDWVLLAVAGYVAVSSLVRMMIGHRDQLVARLRAEMEAEKHRQALAEKQQKKIDAKKRQRENAA